VAVFAQIEGAESREIVLRGNMLNQAGQGVSIGELAPGIVNEKD
jgi:hypothetical protein